MALAQAHERHSFVPTGIVCGHSSTRAVIPLRVRCYSADSPSGDVILVTESGAHSNRLMRDPPIAAEYIGMFASLERTRREGSAGR